MFIRFFRSKYFLQYLIFFVFAISLWIDVLISPVNIKPDQQTSGATWLDMAYSYFPLATIILSLVLLISQALVFNQVHDNHRLAERNQLLVAAFYVMMMCSAPILVHPNIMILINFLMIIMMNTMFNILGRHEPYGQVFDASLLAGTAALLYFPAVFFILFIWLCFVVFQIFTWREWTISTLAFLLPYLFLGSYYYWTGDFLEAAKSYISKFTDIKPVVVAANTYSYIVWGLLALQIILVFNRMMHGISETTIDLRKKNRVVLLFLFVVAVSAVYSGENFRLHLTLAAIPVSAIFGTYFSHSKKLLIPEIITTLILIVIFAGKFISMK